MTGTLISGTLRVGDELAVVPGRRHGRVRALQVLHQPVPEAAPGSRVAVNLAGVPLAEVERGQALVRAAQWRPSSTVDASLRVLPHLHHDVSRRGSYVMYIGSGEHHVRVRLLGGDALPSGGEGAVRLHLHVELPLLPGDHYVLRESGRGETVGGGEVLDVAPVLPASRARPLKVVDRVIAEREWVDVNDLEALTGERRSPDVGRWVVASDALGTTRKYAVPLLSHLDATGVTRRRGERRIAGPRLPAISPPDEPTGANDAGR